MGLKGIKSLFGRASAMTFFFFEKKPEPANHLCLKQLTAKNTYKLESFLYYEEVINSSFTSFSSGTLTKEMALTFTRFCQTIYEMASALPKNTFQEKNRARVVFAQARVLSNGP